MDGSAIIEIRRSPISGKGSFATTTIPKGTFITTLRGEPFSKAEIEAICTARNLTNTDPLQIDHDVMLALDYPSLTINHSCYPNCGIRHQNELYAIRDIQLNDEITYDYSTTVGTDDTTWGMPCLCGTAPCRKTIRNILSIPRTTLETYAELNALPRFIQVELALSLSLADS